MFGVKTIILFLCASILLSHAFQRHVLRTPSKLRTTVSERTPVAFIEKLRKAARYVAQKPLRLRYAAAMSARIAWFISQGIGIRSIGIEQAASRQSSGNQTTGFTEVLPIVQAITEAILSADDDPTIEVYATSSADQPAQQVFFNKNFASIIQMLRKDLKNIDEGKYKFPYDLDPLVSPSQWAPWSVLPQLSNYVSDRRKVIDRRIRRDGLEIRNNFVSGKYPDYYLQNFHYQTDGWLSAESAELYDYQVESLFLGTGDAMRRVVMAPIADFMHGKDPSDVKLLDIATGTGRFASFVLDNFPSLDCTVLDLSPFYLAEAKKTLKKFPAVTYAESAAEKMPFADAQFDAITCVYMFHELPNEVRVKVVAEMARVLKPGGQVFFVDSAQRGEAPTDVALDAFTVIAHEPYYNEYTNSDLTGLFKTLGFEINSSDVWWVSKSLVLTKKV